MMEVLHPFFEYLVLFIKILTVGILAYGVLITGIQFVKTRFQVKGCQRDFVETTKIKNQLASYILLSLEVLIAADIIETIANPSKDEIIVLAAIVVIRTVISFFLNKEIKDFEEVFEK